MKYLLLIALALVGLWMMRRGLGRGPGRARSAKPSPQARPAAQAAPILACRHCGLHLPQNEAVIDADGQAYCSEAHRRAGDGGTGRG